ncbi:MAG: hypothetical protein IKJ33_04810 [Clostridia bacterium]|nr:hypothetical protein [Clostridia bacterium]
MNNFFYSSSDYDLFKKALRSTKNEPVVINILSDDSSLNESGEANPVVNSQRKQMSSKFQASPFDKFFGPRKKRTDPLDMKDFSSWKNKNYRESEKQIDSTPEETTKFSFSDYLNSRARDKRYNNEDELKAEGQKSIEQMSSKDENFQKFSLDSYLNKLEQQTKAKKDFSETDDLVSDFVDENAMMQNSDIDQDENFLNRSNVGVEDIAFGSEIKGDKFSFDREELDSFKARLDKLEREANNIKDKPTTKVISSSDINSMTRDEDDEFNFDKLGIEDDIERVNQKLDSISKVLNVSGDEETEAPKVEGNKFFEIKKAFDDADSKMEEPSNISTTGMIAQTISETAPGLTPSANAGSTVVITQTGAPASSVETAPAQVSVNESVSIPSAPAATSAQTSTSTVVETTSSGAQTKTEAGVVKPVVIVGATANAEELKDEEPATEEDTNSFVDAVEFIDDQTNSAGDGEIGEIGQAFVGVDGVGAVDGMDFAMGEEPNASGELKGSDEYITKTDLRNITDEIIGKFSEMTRNGQAPQGGVMTGDYGESYGEYAPEQLYGGQSSMVGQNPFGSSPLSENPLHDQNTNVFGIVAGGGGSVSEDQEYKKKHDELQAQLMELIEQNKKTDEEISKKLEMAEKEKLRVAEEYEKRLRELEESMQKREEAVKQQAYIEKLKNDIKFKKSENKYKLREEQIREDEKLNSLNLLECEKLKSELRNCLSVSNLEMDKKLLECVNKMHKEEIVKQEQKVEELQQDLQEEMEKPSKPKTTPAAKRRPSTVRSRMRTRTPRRKIDSDIIGGINFD